MKLTPPTSSNVDRIADWLELHVLSTNARISKSKVVSIITSLDLGLDEADADSVLGELGRRLLLYGRIKPYRIQHNQIIPTFKWTKHPELMLCLYFSTYGVGKIARGGTSDRGTKLFEDLTKECLEAFLACESIAFGAPAKTPFKEQLSSFAKAISAQPGEDPQPTDKDRDVDLIVYKKFDDLRNNCILLFVQCAAGKHWDTKKPVAIASYRRFVSFTQATAIPSLATTQLINISDWKNAGDDYGIVIDRARLFQMSTSGKVISSVLRKQIVTWFSKKLTR